MSTAAALHPWLSVEPYAVTVEQYRAFRKDGYLVVRGLVLPEHVAELKTHTEDLIEGRIQAPNVDIEPGLSVEERIKRLLRIHMGHRDLELWERYLLYPRVLDVVQALHGPDVLAMQTMMFIKGPQSDGQGFHQDSYYIPTFPDSLIGAWIAIDPADTENGCLWMSTGSQVEPIYPPSHGYGFGDVGLSDIPYVEGVGGHSNGDDDPLNTLKPLTKPYAQVEKPCVMQPGDVAFFGGHVFHRSLRNRSQDRTRRCLVNHYCNARSYTPWDGGNKHHILARGNTHLEFAVPKFGTPCAATDPERQSISDGGFVPTMMMATTEGTMGEALPSVDPHED
jgi:ectoine hydroxylase-related dioxygenase (phytanoyl-CoA dioxygenase family)